MNECVCIEKKIYIESIDR